MWFILYSDFHGEKVRKVCTIVTRGVRILLKAQRIYIVARTRSVTGRARVHAYARAFAWRVRIAICRSPMHDGFVRLFYMHRNWFAPDTGLAIEWRVSMCSPPRVPPDSSLAFVFSSSSCNRPMEIPRGSRESPRAHLIRSFVPCATMFVLVG